MLVSRCHLITFCLLLEKFTFQNGMLQVPTEANSFHFSKDRNYKNALLLTAQSDLFSSLYFYGELTWNNVFIYYCHSQLRYTWPQVTILSSQINDHKLLLSNGFNFSVCLLKHQTCSKLAVQQAMSPECNCF